MWKFQLTIAINSISSKGNDEEHVMHSKSNNIEIMVNDKLEDVIKELFQSLLSRYQIGMKTSMRVSDFIFDCVHLLYYKCHEVSFNQGGSYIDSPDWRKSKKVTINPIKKDNKCFKYAVTFALNHEETRKTCKE